MARQRRPVKKRNQRRLPLMSQSESRLTRDKTIKEIGKLTKNLQNYNHPYATRSKKLDNSVSLTIFKAKKKATRKLSENSVIFLGAYRKVPQLINLDDTISASTPPESSRYSFRKFCENINNESCYKIEPMDCQDVGQEV
ncbi:hypothetical protein PV325_005313 [Microctonus aethiopoides]|uniref:Uncharacterized protein n=1 Tax=Microctonus aethiopoides TaxID=144406 RepID=A0AA39EVP3_9HYME|nr:hypothetical protein PV325_005313 [Microctonus aethiopoides]KAK0157664.1 hypothetical protein PV328_011375 [Microctonus aethiopoides]